MAVFAFGFAVLVKRFCLAVFDVLSEKRKKTNHTVCQNVESSAVGTDDEQAVTSDGKARDEESVGQAAHYFRRACRRKQSSRPQRKHANHGGDGESYQIFPNGFHFSNSALYLASSSSLQYMKWPFFISRIVGLSTE